MLLRPKFFVRIVEIYRRNDESCRDKIHPLPIPIPVPIFHRVRLSCCMNFQIETIMTVDKAEICLLFEGLEEMTGK